ncbi:MAG TPA: type II toxin-antitoxin system RelE/ParE family toxin [Caulobacteraceae bacterium]|nr:type II toxin-antitoxin system RelE/ParE family toxin [Caulobacteraceae bacterium]
MAWTIEIEDHALRQLRKLGGAQAARIIDFLRERIAVLDDPRSAGQALRGSALGEFWRYRVGDYRLVCRIEDARLVVLVVALGHRREVYR